MHSLAEQAVIEHYTREDHQRWEGDWELIQGIPLAMAPSPGVAHQRVSGRLYAQLAAALDGYPDGEALFGVDIELAHDTIVEHPEPGSCSACNWVIVYDGHPMHHHACIMNRQTGYLAMPSLQIRDLPQDLYQHLALRAEREHRSLAQQALADLQQAYRSNTPAHRRQVIAAIRADLADAAKTAEDAHEQNTHTVATPEQLMRADRDR